MNSSWIRRSGLSLGLTCWLAASAGLSAAEPGETFGWRIGPAAWSFNRFTLFEAVDKTAALGLRYLEAYTGQRLSPDSQDKMGPGLSAEAIAQLRANLAARSAKAQPLYVGWAGADLTPARPVLLMGQLHKRISRGVADPITATVLALETKSADGTTVEQALVISMDIIDARRSIQDRVKTLVQAKLPDFDADKLFLNGTHTHTAPVESEYGYAPYQVIAEEKAQGVMSGDEYGAFLGERLAEAAARAWTGRQPGGMSWALGHAVVGHQRRAVYFAGHAQMYGRTATPDFDRLEGYEDHSLPLLFFWGAQKRLTGIMVNVACPAQETEGAEKISADFWHETRLELRRRHGQDLFVLPQCSAAGDLSPHLLWQQPAEQKMLERKGISRRQEIALRLADGVDRVFPLSQTDIQTELVFKHTVARVDLPPVDPARQPFYATDSIQPIEFHVLRLGEVALATNPFELYLDYGLRIKAQSKATLTLLVQLSSGNSGYLPTAQAVRGGGYSADKFVAGPEGGQVLVTETVKQINTLYP